MAQPAPAAPELSPKMFAVPALMMGVRMLKIDFGEYLIALRILYVTVQVVSIGLYFYMAQAAAKKAEAGSVIVEEKVPTTGETKKRTLTIAEYDAEECMKKIKQLGMGMCIVGFIHYKWGSPMPLLLQSVMAPVNMSDDPLIKIHILGKPAKDKCARPFKTANPLADFLSGGDKTQETAAAKKAD